MPTSANLAHPDLRLVIHPAARQPSVVSSLAQHGQAEADPGRPSLLGPAFPRYRYLLSPDTCAMSYQTKAREVVSGNSASGPGQRPCPLGHRAGPTWRRGCEQKRELKIGFGWMIEKDVEKCSRQIHVASNVAAEFDYATFRFRVKEWKPDIRSSFQCTNMSAPPQDDGPEPSQEHVLAALASQSSSLRSRAPPVTSLLADFPDPESSLTAPSSSSPATNTTRLYCLRQGCCSLILLPSAGEWIQSEPGIARPIPFTLASTIR